MKTSKQNRTAQRPLFPEWEINEKSTKKGCPPDSQVINSYLTTREGLFRLVTMFPGSMPVGEAVRTFHRRISHGKEVAV